MNKTSKWLIFVFWFLMMAMFPIPVIAVQFILFIVLCLLMWVKVLLGLAYMVVKYGIFYGI